MTSKTYEAIKTEKEQQKTKRQTMLADFKKYGELTTKDLLKYGPGLSSRLHELRKDYRIVTVFEKPGNYRYMFLGEREDASK